jgi:hypothetical protein
VIWLLASGCTRVGEKELTREHGRAGILHLGLHLILYGHMANISSL